MRRLFGFLFFLMFAVPAWAAPVATPPSIAGIPMSPTGGGSSLLYSLAPYDLSYTLLKDVFGPVVSDVANGTFFTAANTQGTNGPQASGSSGAGGSLLGSFFGVYNEAMLLVVAVLTLWHGITGVAVSADSGEWLGKKTSSFWAPVRVTMATGMLLPVFGGYSLVQGVIFWAILQGSGVADQASAAAASYLARNPVVGNPITPQGSTLASNILANETCAYYLNNRVYPSLRGYTPSSSTPANMWGVLFVRSVSQPTTASDVNISREWYAPSGQPVHFSQHSSAGPWAYVSSQTGSKTNFHNMATTVSDAWMTNPAFNNATYGRAVRGPALCGSVSVKIPYTNSGQGGLLGSIGNPATLSAVRNKLEASQVQALNKLEASLEPLAEAFASTHMPIGVRSGQILPNASAGANSQTASQIQENVGKLPAYASALGAYDYAMETAGERAWQGVESQSNAQSIQSQISSQGWVSLGDIFWVLAQNDEAVRQMINFTATSAGPRVPASISAHGYGSYERLPQILAQVKAFTSLTNSRFHAALSKAAASNYSALAGRRAGLYAAAGETTAAEGSAAYSGVVHTVESVGGIALGTVIGRLSSRIITGSYFQNGNPSGLAPIGNMGMSLGGSGSKQVNQNNIAPQGVQDMTTGDPMFEIQQMGRRMTSVGAGIVALSAAASIASDADPEMKAVLHYVIGGGMISECFKIIVAGLIVGGFVLGVYLPMLPLIIWLTGVMAWLIMVAETMLAAPVWVVGHASLEGEGWSPRGSRTGYQLLAGLLLRPSLMVGGLLIGMLIMSAMDWLLGIMSQSYLTEIFGSGGITGAIFSFGMLMVVGGTLVFIAQSSLSLITKVPDGVLKWIGGGQGTLGSEDATRGHDTVVAGVSSRVERASAAGSGKPGVGGGAGGGGHPPASASRSSSRPSEKS